jgi:hypothetical protein
MSRLMVGCVLLLSAGAVRGELVCPESPLEAGRVIGGKVLEYRFTLINRGGFAVEVTEVKPGCGCLRPVLDTATILPGGQCILTLQVNTLTQAPGPNAWRAVVHYREKGQPGELPVYVRGILTPIVSVTPAALILHTRTSIRGEFTLIERTAAPLPVRALFTTSNHVRTSCSAPVRCEEGWKRIISLEVLPTLPEGRYEDALKIHTTDPEYAELSVPFTVVKHSAGAVQPSPSLLRLAVLDASALPSSIVLLSAGDDKPVIVDRVESSHPFIACTWASGPGPRSTLRVRFDREKMPAEKNFEAAIRVHLKEPAGQVVTIPVQVTGR